MRENVKCLRKSSVVLRNYFSILLRLEKNIMIKSKMTFKPLFTFTADNIFKQAVVAVNTPGSDAWGLQVGCWRKWIISHFQRW